MVELIKYGVAGHLPDVDLLYEDYRYDKVQLHGDFVFYQYYAYMLNHFLIKAVKAIHLLPGIVKRILPWET